MKRLSLRSLFVPVAAAALITACGDDDTDDPVADVSNDVADAADTGTPDATPDAQVDADAGVDAAPDTRDASDISDTPDAADTSAPTNACGDADQAAIGDDPDLFERCASTCWDDDDRDACVDTCVTDAGLTSECAECGTRFVGCVASACATECDDFDLDCQACAVVCDDAFQSCVGRGDGPDRAVDLCVGRLDASLVQGDTDLTAVALDCAEGCAGDALCERRCTADETGISRDCAICFVRDAACVEASCGDRCDDLESGACLTCRATECDADRAVCEGEAPAEGPAMFNIVNVARGVGPVSVWNEELQVAFASDVLPGTGVSAETLGSEQPIAFRAADATATDPVLATAAGEFPFGPGSLQTVGLFGPALSPSAYWVREDRSDPPDGVRYRIVNATDGGTIDVYDLSGGTDVLIHEDVAEGGATPDAGRASGPMTIGIDVDDDGAVDVLFELGTLAETSQHTFWFSLDDTDYYVLDSTQDGTFTRIDPSVDD